MFNSLFIEDYTQYLAMTDPSFNGEALQKRSSELKELLAVEFSERIGTLLSSYTIQGNASIQLELSVKTLSIAFFDYLLKLEKMVPGEVFDAITEGGNPASFFAQALKDAADRWRVSADYVKLWKEILRKPLDLEQIQALGIRHSDFQHGREAAFLTSSLLKEEEVPVEAFYKVYSRKRRLVLTIPYPSYNVTRREH